MAERLEFDVVFDLKQAKRELDALLSQSKNTRITPTIDSKAAATSGKQFGTSFSGGANTAVNAGFAKIAGVATAALGGVFAAIQIGDFVGGSVRQFIEIEDAIADIQKTTGITGDELNDLSDDILELSGSSRNSNEEMLALAESAGRLGIQGADNVLGFVEAADKLAVALGDDFSGGAEEATLKVGKLVTLFDEFEGEEIGDSFLFVSNALNTLAASGNANASQIAEFSNRLAGLAPQLDAGDVLGYSTALTELGVTAERGSSSIGRLLGEISQEDNIESFASAIGQTADEFRNLVNTDANDAILQFAEGLKDGTVNTVEFNSLLSELGLNGTGIVEVLNKVGENTELVAEKQALANEALGETSSILDEYNAKNDTTAGKLAQAQSQFQTFRTEIGEKLAPALLALSNFGLKVIDFFEEANKQIRALLKTDVAKFIGKLFVQAFEDLVEAGKELFEQLKELKEQLDPELTQAVKIIGAIIGGVLVGAILVAIGAIKIIIETLTFLYGAITKGIEFFKNFKQTIDNAFIGAVATASTSISSFINLFNTFRTTATTIFNAIKTAITTSITNAVNTAFNSFNSFRTNVSNIVTNIRDTITSVFTSARNNVVSLFSGIGNTIGNAFNSAVNIVSGIVSSIRSTFSDMYYFIINNVINPIGNSWGNIVGNVVGIIDSIRYQFSRLTGIFTVAQDAVVGGVRNFVNGIVTSFNSVIDSINSVVTRIPGISSGIPNLQYFAQGGLVGDGRAATGAVPAVLNDGRGRLAGQEYVVNAPATRQFLPLLEAMNNIGLGRGDTNNTTTVNKNTGNQYNNYGSTFGYDYPYLQQNTYY